MTLAEQFDVENASAQPIATLSDGTPIAYESKYGKGSAIILGSFAGQQNYKSPTSMHPIAALLAEWAGLTKPQLEASSFIELRQTHAPNGRFVFFFNHSDKPAHVRFTRNLDRPATSIHEITTSQTVPIHGQHLTLETEVPPQSARVYRIDY
jgi:hypothetical protein